MIFLDSTFYESLKLYGGATDAGCAAWLARHNAPALPSGWSSVNGIQPTAALLRASNSAASTPPNGSARP